jgi:hypothetical protein
MERYETCNITTMVGGEEIIKPKNDSSEKSSKKEGESQVRTKNTCL